MNAVPSPKPTLTPDFAEAKRFLDILAPGETEFTFQTYDDKKPKDPSLSKVLHGTFDQHADRLAALNARGAAVCVVVNRTNLKGRDATDVTGVRAVFADFDGVPLEARYKLDLEPHIIVESSPNRWHVYYRTTGVTLDLFTGIQKKLIALFGSDHSVYDLPRVMRLPGFFHQKDPSAAFMTRIEDVTKERPYGRHDLPRSDERDQPSDESADNVVAMPEPEEREKAFAMAQEFAQRTHEGGVERRPVMHNLAFRLREAGISRVTANVAARVFAKECRPTCSEGSARPFAEKDALDIVANAYKPGKLVKPREEKRAKKVPVSQLDQLVKLAKTADIWRTDQTTYYATVRINGRVEHMQTDGQDFRRWLTREYINATKGRSPGSQAVADAAKNIEAISTEAPIHRTACRVGQHGDKLYIDLCDQERRAIEIDADGWRIVAEAPVRFIRSAGMLALPEPVRGGSINELRPFVTMGDASFKLLVATMLAYLRPTGPFPILAVHGEHGTAKSTTSRFVKNLIDPNTATLRRPPREDRDLVTAAKHSWLLAFDNISTVPQWMSDSFCVLSTEGSYTARAMRTDYDEIIIANLCRPLLLNGISDINEYADLTSRTVRIVLDPISERDRKTDAEMRAAFEAAHPRLLGALYTAISSAIRRLPTTKLDRKPRMADFATWATAAEEGLGWSPGAFMAAFEENQETSVLDGVSGDTVAQALVGFVSDLDKPADENNPCWEGTATDLHGKLDGYISDDMRRTNFWPKSARHLSGRVRKLAHGLRVAGVRLETNRKDPIRNVSLIAIYRTAEELGIDGYGRYGLPRDTPKGSTPSNDQRGTPF